MPPQRTAVPITASTSFGNRSTPFKPPGPAKRAAAVASGAGSGVNLSRSSSSGGGSSSLARKPRQSVQPDGDVEVGDAPDEFDEEFGTALDLEASELDLLERGPTHARGTAPAAAGAAERTGATAQRNKTKQPATTTTSAAPRRADPATQADTATNDSSSSSSTSDSREADTADIPGIPAPLLARIMHEHLGDKSVRVGREANGMMRRYVDVFVREAVARAAEGRREAKLEAAAAARDADARADVATGRGKGKGVAGAAAGRQPAGKHDRDANDADDDVWLDTEDLERITPGMVLDF